MYFKYLNIKIFFGLFGSFFILLISDSFSSRAFSSSENSLDILIQGSQPLAGHPIADGHQIHPGLAQLLYGPLFRLDSSLNSICDICEVNPSFENDMIKVSRSSSSSGRISIEVKIKKDAKWGDGVSLTGHDLAFSWKVGKALSKELPEKTIYDNIISVDVPRGKPKTAIILLNGAHFQNKILDDFYVIARHIENPIWTKYSRNTEKYLKHSTYYTDPTNPALFYRFYKLAKFQHSQTEISLEENARSVLGKPLIKKVNIKQNRSFKNWVPDNSEVYIFSETDELLFNSMKPIEKKPEFDKYYRKEMAPGLLWEQAVLNHRNPFLNDLRIRKAIKLAIDWKQIPSAVGSSDIITSPNFEPPFSPYFWSSSDLSRGLQTHAPQSAQSLIKDAGWRKSADDRYWTKDNETLNIELVLGDNNQIRKNLVHLVASSLEKIGIKTDVSEKSSTYFRDEILSKTRFSGIAFFGIEMSSNLAPASLYHSSEIPTFRNNYAGQNLGAWYSKDMDNLFETLDLSLSKPKRIEQYKKLQELYEREVPGFSFFFYKQVALVPKNLSISKSKLGENILSTLPSWSWQTVAKKL